MSDRVMSELLSDRDRAPIHRRKFLRRAVASLAAIGSVTAAAAAQAEGKYTAAPPGSRDSAATQSLPYGAIYIPARAWNAYQMWQHYDPDITKRDLRLARSLRLNALRVWLSYEFWLKDPAALQQRFAHFLNSCHGVGIKVLPVLFEGDGVEPTAAHIADVHPLTASDLLSPASPVVMNPRLWHGALKYLDWFMDHYRNDQRLLAIEVQNEPWGAARHRFAEAMMRHAAKHRGTTALSIGGANLKQSMAFMDAGADILQTHPDFPASVEAVHRTLHDTIMAEKSLKKSVWVTEWQRIRTGGSGWGNQGLTGNQWEPDYASMAPMIRAKPVGSFFWSLMLKPAWLLAQRGKGTLNGVFHEDGAVWSLRDARAISGNTHFQALERKAWPRWAQAIPQSLGMPIKIIKGLPK